MEGYGLMPRNEGVLDRTAWQALVGLSATDTIGFYGATPVAQRTSSIQAASVVSATSFISVTSNLAAFCAEVAATLTGLGVWKGV
jgi:hypothetical protein